MALSVTFGYELDIIKIAEEERNMIPEQTQMYHKYHDLIREGDYFRIASYREIICMTAGRRRQKTVPRYW